jgi:hypothetical protein
MTEFFGNNHKINTKKLHLTITRYTLSSSILSLLGPPAFRCKCAERRIVQFESKYFGAESHVIQIRQIRNNNWLIT